VDTVPKRGKKATMREFSVPQKIWMQLFQRFIERGVRDLRDLASLNTITHALMRTIPAEEARAFLPTLSTICAVCHVRGEPSEPRCDAHQTNSGTVIYMGDEGSAVGTCGDCRKRVEQLSSEAEAENPTDPLGADACFKPLRTVN
jgi:hypothetical protein